MPSASEKFDWDEVAIQWLKDLWAEGHSTAEIGRRMNVSKNAVVGKSHRLKLTSRPSPIRTADSDQGRLSRPQSQDRPTESIPPVALALPVVAPRPPSSPPPSPPTRAHRLTAGSGAVLCCWPIGDPNTPDFAFCGAVNVAGKPYCAEHCFVAYRKPTDRRVVG